VGHTKRKFKLSKKTAKVDMVFEYFNNKYKLNQSFTLEELVKKTGWKLSTVITYINKKWNNLLVKNGLEYTVSVEFSQFDKYTFRQHNSQKDKGGVSKYFYSLLVDKAIIASLSAIEIYNKPDFKFREETFSILMVNAWELLLKAKILQDNNDNKDSIYFKEKGTIVKTESGNPKTISISKALKKLESSNEIKENVGVNIRLLLEIRNNSVHFIHNDTALAEKIQGIGTASLKNFMRLATNWFSFDFQKFNFYILPLFFHNPTEVESFSVDNNPQDQLRKYLEKIENKHENNEDPNFSISQRLEVKVVKTDSGEAIPVKMTNDPDAPKMQISTEKAFKAYPHTYKELCEILVKRYKDFKKNCIFHSLKKEFEAKGEKFCKKNWLNPTIQKGTHKKFYHNRIIEEFDKHYERK